MILPGILELNRKHPGPTYMRGKEKLGNVESTDVRYIPIVSRYFCRVTCLKHDDISIRPIHFIESINKLKP